MGRTFCLRSNFPFTADGNSKDVDIDLMGLPPDTWGQPLGSQLPTNATILVFDCVMFHGTIRMKGSIISIVFDVAPISGMHTLLIRIFLEFV